MSNSDSPTIELIIDIKNASQEQRDIIQNNGRIVGVFPMIDSIAIRIDRSLAEEILQLGSISAFYENTSVTAQMNNAKKAIHAALAVESAFGVSSEQDVTVAFLDTGIYPSDDFTYPDNRIVAFIDFVNGKDEPYDDNGHGSHVSGICCGNGSLSGGKYSGIAPLAKIAAIKVLDKNGEGDTSTALSGLQWVMDNKERYNIKVVNLSVGTEAISGSDPLVRAVEVLWDSGVCVCAASGNNGPANSTVTSPGTSRKIITVGTIDDGDNVDIWGKSMVHFSGRGPTKDCVVKPDLVAPGSRIISVLARDSSLSKDVEKIVSNHYAILSGTSMSTPFVSGAIALLLGQNPSATPNQIKYALCKSAKDLCFPKNQQGFGLLNVEAFLAENLPTL